MSTSQQVARELFQSRRTELQEDMRTMSDEFDKGILTLSSGGLGLSLAFLKDVIPLAEAHFLWMLYSSWIAFVTAITLTLLSYLFSLQSLKCALEDATEYYLHGRDDCLNRSSWYSSVVVWFRWLSGTGFVLAIALTSLFVARNVQLRSTTLSNSSKPIQTKDGRIPLAAIEKLGETKGRVPLPMTPVPDVNTGRVPPGAVPKSPAPTAPTTPAQPSNQKK